jgi:hypothetical protein
VIETGRVRGQTFIDCDWINGPDFPPLGNQDCHRRLTDWYNRLILAESRAMTARPKQYNWWTLTMKHSNIAHWIFGACMVFLFAPNASQAQIYKWVDANGQTHYSEKKEDADRAKALELKIKSEQTSTQAPDPLMRNLQAQESQSRKRREQKPAERSSNLPAPSKPESRTGGYSECQLARDVLSGAVKHRNGAATDAYDREVAENDIRTYCK